ncbi:MAG: DUF4340 domain-containing protein [Myxococcales bacterium]
MTGRGLAAQGGLAALGLVIAYTTWQREPERAAGEIVVIDANKSDLKNVHYEDENTSVDIHGGSEVGESGVWLKVQDKTPVPPTPPAKPATAASAVTNTATPPPPPTVAKPRPVRQLRGDEPAEKLMAEFAPFHSARAFGVLDAAKVKELGLDKAKKKLVVTARGETREFVIGQPPQSSGESYLRDVKDGRTYLMPRQLLTDLQGASFRLVDRKLHTFKIADVDRVTVTAGGKTREFVVSNRQDQAAYKLAPKNTPDKPDEMARNWHDKIWRLFPSELLGKGEAPAGGQPKVVARIDYFDGGKNVGWLELGKVEVPVAPEPAASPHAVAASNNGVEVYGRTEHTAGWVRLHNDPSTLTDADKIAAGS